MKILVTGGAGFIGSHLTEALLAAGHQVTVWDNFYTGQNHNLAALPAQLQPALSVFNYDIRQPHDFSGDVIINLACPASPVHYQRDPIYTWETSVLGVHQLLQLAEASGARFLHASTSEVYGDPLEHPQKESYWGNVNPVGIRSCYDEGKRAAETLITDYQRLRGVDARIFRIFNTYGPRMQADDGRVVSNFIVQALAGQPLTIFGDGRQTRSFAYVSDLVAGILKIMALPRGSLTQPVNLGNPSEFTILELAELVFELAGKEALISFQPLPSDDPQRRQPDISLASSLLGWQPKVALRDGLAQTIDYFRQKMAEQNLPA